MRLISLLAICSLAIPLFSQTDLPKQLQHVIEELKIPDAFGYPVFPETASLNQFSIEDEVLSIHLDLSFDFLYKHLDDQILDEIIEHFVADLSDYSFESIRLLARTENGNPRELSEFIPNNPIAGIPDIPNEDPSPAIKGAHFTDSYSDVQPLGQLENKTVWLSAGHGWIYDSRFKSFRTQRHNTHGLVEDFSNIEMINYHLLKYLYNAGANVWTVRERDMNPNEIIVDNDQGAPAYREYGRWATSTTSGRNQRSYRYAISKKEETSTAVFTPTISESGLYWVSVFYQNGYNRSVDTRYRILHAGGESHVSINQEVHGNTWVYLGQFYFEKGQEGQVIISNESHETSQAIVADAVRFGGGMGDLGDCYHDKKSGEPRYEEGARYYAKYQGYPKCEGDISIRPKYAEWELAKGTKQEQQNAIYLSWHSNASGAQGTETFVHRYKRRLGSRDLQKSIHNQLIQDIRKDYDPDWRNRGQKAADFGELRGLQTMPGVLLEIGFHDNKHDAYALSDPQFRNLVARSTYKGIATYFARRANQDPVFLPEPPTHLVAKNISDNRIQLSWNAPHFGGVLGDRATEYKVYISQHGKAFPAGYSSKSNSYVFENLQPGTTYYFKVTATNEGGESFPTAIVAARTPAFSDQEVAYLIVDGFDRLDRSLAIIQKEQMPRYAPLGNTRRLRIEQMNNYDYSIPHAKGLAASGISFDGATNEAIIDKQVDLNDYYGINWFLGRESSTDKTLSYIEQSLLKDFLDQGGNLIISGSELAFDLVKSNNGKSFYHQYIKADYVADDAMHYSIASFRNDDFRDLNGPIQKEQHSYYPLRSPDIIKSKNGSRPILQYRNGKVAATAFRGDYAVVNFGFPLETISDDLLREDIFKKSILYINPAHKPETEIVNIPSHFFYKIEIDLNKATEGNATFNLYDSLGKAVLRETWAYDGKSKKTIFTRMISDGAYTYEFKINGQTQKGKISKKKDHRISGRK